MEAYIAPDEESQFQWLRGLVGGNHQFTTEIAVELVNFSFEEINNAFAEKLSKIQHDVINS
jgi:hypothetical protein